MTEQAPGPSPLGSTVYPKAQVLNRLIAKLLDLFLAAAASVLVPPVGWLGGLAYLLLADGFSGGRSIGKRVVGLQTVVMPTHDVSGFKESIIRNLPLAIAYLVFPLPYYVGWALAACVVGFEALLVIGNEQGHRLGDEIARTQVLDAGLLDIRD